MRNTIYCWVWDHQCSIDIAAWVQAIGSLVALGITVFLYYHQITHQQRQTRKSQTLAAIHFANMVGNLLLEFQELLDTNATEKSHLRFLGERVHDLVKWSGTFNIDTFSQDEAIHFFRTRDAAHKLTLWVSLYEPEQIIAGKSFLDDLCEQTELDINELMNLNQSNSLYEKLKCKCDLLRWTFG